MNNRQANGTSLFSVSNGHTPNASINHNFAGCNGYAKGWIVQKFGGTSIGKFAATIAEDIVKSSLAHHRVVVVCSARSSNTKADGTTNRLLRAAHLAETAGPGSYEQIVQAISEDHINAAKQNINSVELLATLVDNIEKECRDLLAFLEATQRVGEISPRSQDKIISKGEKLSCRFLAALLEDRGVESQYIDISEIINFNVTKGLNAGFYETLAARLAKEILPCIGKVPVVTGCFGLIPGGLLDGVGRGYTDLCAALIAVGIKAEELQIWKEVDGIFSADPRKVPTARLLSTITPSEAAELTFYGSEVVHPFTMEQAIRARIPIRIRNVTNLRSTGTLILPDPKEDAVGNPKMLRARSSSSLAPGERPKRPTAVTIKRGIVVINVHSNRRSLSHGFFANLFSSLDRWKLSVDLISTSEVHISMALHSEGLLSGGEVGEEELTILDESLHGVILELREYGTVDIIPKKMAILSLVGKQMKNMVGIAGKMFSTLGDNEVNIEMISQGASEINISCVIEERDADRAINILHTHLFTFLE